MPAFEKKNVRLTPFEWLSQSDSQQAEDVRQELTFLHLVQLFFPLHDL